MWCFVFLFLVVSASAIDCLERLVSEMTCYVSSGTLNPAHSLTLTSADKSNDTVHDIRDRNWYHETVIILEWMII